MLGSRNPESHRTFSTSESAVDEVDYEAQVEQDSIVPPSFDKSIESDPGVEPLPNSQDQSQKTTNLDTQEKQLKSSNKDQQIQEEQMLSGQKRRDSLKSSASFECESTDLEESVECSHLPPDIDPAMVNRYFKVLFAAILIMSIDLGILPACSVKIQNELGIDNWKFGLLGSVVYFGQTMGAVMSSVMLNYVPPKIFLFVCIICNIITLIYFTITDNFSNLLICRMLTGLFQIFFGVYQPVWADAFGNERQKSLWISYLIIATPLGTIIGYLMTAVFQDNIGWRYSFYIQAVLLIPSTVYIALIPRKYQDVKMTGMAIKYHQMKQERRKQSFQQMSTQGSCDDNEQNYYSSPQSSDYQVNSGSSSEEELPTSNNTYDLQLKEKQKFDKNQVKIPFFQGIKLVLQNREFCAMCMAITCLYFVVTGIQFWFSDYMITEMGIDKQKVFTWFGIVSITGPILGVFVGGQITTALGGYKSLSNLYSVLVMSIFSIFFALPIPFMNQTVPIVGLVWLELFTGGYMLPSMTGLMLNTVDQELKTTSNSIANICYNILGFLPSPIVFGLISDMGPHIGGNKRNAMLFLMCMPIAAVGFLFYAAYSLKKRGFGTQLS